MRFENGELYERSFQTAAGPIEVLAEIVILGDRIELRTSPTTRESERLTVRPEDLLSWARVVFAELAEAGFAEVHITATRLSGARPGRKVDLVVRLRKEHP